MLCEFLAAESDETKTVFRVNHGAFTGRWEVTLSTGPAGNRVEAKPMWIARKTGPGNVPSREVVKIRSQIDLDETFGCPEGAVPLPANEPNHGTADG